MRRPSRPAWSWLSDYFLSKKVLTIALATAFMLNAAYARPFRVNICFELDPDINITFETGSTGFGIGLDSHLNKNVRLRTGFNWVPRFEYPMNFNIQVGEDGDPGYDAEGHSRFDRMAGYLEEMTGFKIDQQVEMIGVPSFNNFKLLFDVSPFNNKNWYFTAGFYAGSSIIGRAYNRTEDMTTLMSVAMYNNIYDKVYDIEYNDESELNGVFLGLELPPAVNNKILDAGRMGMHIGDYKDKVDENGNPIPYMMEPDQDNMVKAEMKVNSFRPYIGAGYSGPIYKLNDRFRFSVDCGIMFWGGTPKVYTHDGTDIVSELENITSQVDKYVDKIKPLKVYPMLNLSISYRLTK